MNHSFLVHVSRTIPRSKANQSMIAQLQGTNATKPQGSRPFSSRQQSPSVTFWGEGIAHSLRASPSKSIFVTLQPLRNPAAIRRQANRSASTYTSATMHLKERDPSDDPSGLPPSNGAAAGGQGNNGDNWDDGKPPSGSSGAIVENQLQKPTVPDVYPQVLALPITRRPLFPGFYKAVVIKDPHVTAAIKELLKRGQPYIGAFLLKDEKLDVDTITSIDQIHPVGVFAQITSVFPASAGKDGKDDGGLTAVLYPHRRIKMTELLPMMNKHSTATVKPAPTEQTAGVEHLAVEPAAVEPATVEPLLRTPEEKPKEEELMKTDHEPGMAKDDSIVQHQAELDSVVTKDTQYATAFLAKDYAVSVGNVENLVDPPYSKKSPIVRAITSEIVSVFKEIASLNPLFRDQIASFSMSQSAGNVFEEPAKLADFAAAVSAGEQAELQEVLETLPVEDRLQKALVVLKKELMNAQLQNKISKEVETKIAKRQREYYLMEQMKGIKKELGLESDGKDKLVEGFKEKATKLAMPIGVKKVFDEEINKLAHLEPAASEFNVTRNYLDWLTQVPWGQRSRENYNIVHAKKVLDEDHYGLQDVKDRILEFIAVGKLTGSVEGKIICLSGPPGVGKTSIGKSIARALDREFYRFSVGGLTDVAEIKGHRRTYVGAMPGKVIQALKKVQTENPLVLIDEIDKIGRGHQGDPSSALLELLDPEQNSSFLDHYMDVPVDLSKVLFVCTANVLDTIPGPLLDRMEVIQLSGYIAEEKSAIASKYLAPAAKLSAGLEHVDVNLTEEAVDMLIKSYCRESGVRNLKKHIDKVFRKAAFKVVQDLGDDKFEQQKGDSPKVLEDDIRSNDPEKIENALEHGIQKEVGQEKTQEERKRLEVPDSVHVEVTGENLKDYVGPPIFHSDRLYETTPPGVIMGLAWTSMGGSSLYIESVLESSLSAKSSPHLSTTGQLGDVMKESTTIAYTFAKSLMAKRFPKNKFFEKARLHLHCPAGAVPKDGPSAGITMATSFISLALNKPISHNIAMTGELTVTGKVLQIGGLKEKTIAAKRSNVTTIMFPKDNQADWEELPAHVKKGITGIPVDYYSDVFKVCFGDVEKEQIEKLWQTELAEEEKKD